MYLLIKLNPNALPGSQDARHQCSLKIIQLTILRLMTCLFFPLSELFSIFNQTIHPLQQNNPGSPNMSLVETQGSSLNDLIFTPQMTLMAATTCLPLPSSSLDLWPWHTPQSSQQNDWHSSSISTLAPIHVITAGCSLTRSTRTSLPPNSLFRFILVVASLHWAPALSPESGFGDRPGDLLIQKAHTGRGLPRWVSGKESVCNAGGSRLIPESGRFPWSGYPLQYSPLENPMDRGA